MQRPREKLNERAANLASREASFVKRDAERRLWQGHPDGHWRAIRHEPPLTSQESASRRTLYDISSMFDSRGRGRPNLRRGSSTKLRPPEMQPNDAAAKSLQPVALRLRSSTSSNRWIVSR
jgi:hypothetical protein